MITSKEIQQQFTEELTALLNKFGATIDVDKPSGPHMYGIDKMIVDIPGKYDDNGDLISEHTTFNLGRSI